MSPWAYTGQDKIPDAISDGATIAIPNDGTNEARALYLLEAQSLIKLKKDVGFTATVLDIESNPKNLVIKEIEAAQIARALADVDFGVINGNTCHPGRPESRQRRSGYGR